LREDRKRVFQKRALKIFGPKRDEETRDCIEIHFEELKDLYSSPNIVQVMKWRLIIWVWHVVRMVESRGVNRVLVRKTEGTIPLGRPRRRWGGLYKD